MKRIRLTVAYDGTDYCGWQVQPNGVTIEEMLNRAIRKLTGEDIQVIGASRTDSGVHALGNVAVFDTNSTIPPERLGFELKDGTQFRIALLINDSDGGIRSRTMLFFDGLDGHKDTGKFGLVQLRSGRRK